MHINMVKGDYTYPQWEQSSVKDFDNKIKELECLGYEMVEEEHDYLNIYLHFKNPNEDEIILTLLCC